jgi:hypothetical protein
MLLDATSDLDVVDEAIRKSLAQAIRPDGLIDQYQLNSLKSLFENDFRVGKIGAGAGAIHTRVKKIIADAPRASQILRNGYDIERYKKQLEELEKQQSLYAQPLLDIMASDWRSAVSVLNGYPEGSISSPSPFDDPYESIISNYMGFVRRLEALGNNPALSDLVSLNQDFATQFDRMLTINDIGKGRKKVLIEWLGGKDAYLGALLAKQIISRSPGFPSSGTIPPQ